jgi:MYXO-CTERM domain-containing protein
MTLPTRSLATSLATGVLLLASAPAAQAQDTPGAELGPCPADSVGCARAPIAYRRRAGLPVELDVDTGWVPPSSPLGVRFRAAFVGHTEIAAAGTLEGAWPEPLMLRAVGTPGTGSIASDYGMVLTARVRLHLVVGAESFDWEGNVPYVPQVDLRAMASAVFDPWAWDGVRIHGAAMRQRIADVSLTDRIIPIPGISGGLSFDGQFELTTFYRSRRISFMGAADPITATTDRVRGMFTMGPQAEFLAQLEGRVEQTVLVRIYPSLYVSLLGRRWMLDIAEIPTTLGPFGSDWLFDPSRAVLPLPDVRARRSYLDFGEVPIGTTVRLDAEFDSLGRTDARIASPAAPVSAFSFPVTELTAPPGRTVGLPVTFTPDGLGIFDRRVTFRTNDPDTPEFEVILRGIGVPATETGTEPDAGAPADAATDGDLEGGADADLPTGTATGSCACRTGPAGRAPQGGITALLALGGAFVARRRRVR